MPEPVRSRLRPIPMMRTLAVSTAAVFLLAGCGSGPSSSDEPSSGDGGETASASPSPTGAPTVPSDEPPVSSSYAVDVPGESGPLQVTEQRHPRGGFQLRVFAPDGATWRELRVDDQPLLPFVALDVEEHPWSIGCSDGGLVFTEAVAHEPAGVAFAWDIKRTTYAVEGSTVTPGTTQEIADNVLPAKLTADYPDLVKHTAFTNCRATG